MKSICRESTFCFLLFFGVPISNLKCQQFWGKKTTLNSNRFFSDLAVQLSWTPELLKWRKLQMSNGDTEKTSSFSASYYWLGKRGLFRNPSYMPNAWTFVQIHSPFQLYRIMFILNILHKVFLYFTELQNHYL